MLHSTSLNCWIHETVSIFPNWDRSECAGAESALWLWAHLCATLPHRSSAAGGFRQGAISSIPSGKHPKNDGTSLFLMGKSTISMAIFNRFDITRGYPNLDHIDPSCLHMFTHFSWLICGPFWAHSHSLFLGHGTWTGAGATLQTDDLLAVRSSAWRPKRIDWLRFGTPRWQQDLKGDKTVGASKAFPRHSQGIPKAFPRHSQGIPDTMWWLATMLRLNLQVRHRVEQQT